MCSFLLVPMGASVIAWMYVRACLGLNTVQTNALFRCYIIHGAVLSLPPTPKRSLSYALVATFCILSEWTQT